MLNTGCDKAYNYYDATYYKRTQSIRLSTNHLLTPYTELVINN